MKWLVLDAFGVIYSAGDDVVEWLIPFLRERGCTASTATVNALYTECSLGSFTTDVFWRKLGFSEPNDHLNQHYLRRHTLTTGLIPFLKSMKAKNVPIACLSNDVAEWSHILRRLHGLDAYISQWTISGEARARKPSPEIYTRLLGSLDASAHECLFVDDRPKNLDAAAALEFQTALFAPSGQQAADVNHRVLFSLWELDQYLAQADRL